MSHKKVEMTLRITHRSGDEPDFFALYYELRGVVQKHFKGPIIKRDGATYYFEPIMEFLPPDPSEVRARRVRKG